MLGTRLVRDISSPFVLRWANCIPAALLPQLMNGPFREGCFIHIGNGSFRLCALQAVVAYLVVHGNSGGPLFLFHDGRPLSRALLTGWLRQILVRSGVPGIFSSHSFCMGAATVAARRGIPDHLIQALGRWSNNAYKSYISTPSEITCDQASLLFLSGGERNA